jgi:Fe-Mn family superoxide dismutase
MAPAASPEASYARSASPELKAAVDARFGSDNDMRLKFTDAALGLFGSGWTWLGVDPAGELVITTTPNQARPPDDTHQPALP